MTPNDAWLAAVWQLVRGQLPAPPASVLEVGCGPAGGLVPALRQAGYQATGIDPAAPDRELHARFDSEPVSYGPYFFPDLADVSETDEQAAINHGHIQATRIHYAGHRRRPHVVIA